MKQNKNKKPCMKLPCSGFRIMPRCALGGMYPKYEKCEVIDDDDKTVIPQMPPSDPIHREQKKKKIYKKREKPQQL
jgi:hypothetical protein